MIVGHRKPSEVACIRAEIGVEERAGVDLVFRPRLLYQPLEVWPSLYVDDIVVTGNEMNSLEELKANLTSYLFSFLI